MKTQVLIVGAGPTGLSLAAQLIRYGIDFLIIEKTATTTKLSKAMVVHSRSMEIFDQIELAKEAIKKGEKGFNAKILVNKKVKGRFNLKKVGQGLSKFPYVLVLEQSETEKILFKYLKEHKKKVLWKHEIQKIKNTKSKVEATVKNSKGKTIKITADYLVGCDGASSFVRKNQKFTFIGSTFERFFYVADINAKWKLKHDKNIYISLDKGKFALFFPMKGKNNFRAIGIFPEGFSTENKITKKEMTAVVVNDSQIPLEIPKMRWHSIYKVHSRMAAEFQKGRCFIAGDAAHVHTPAGGQGMNTGIQDAYNLAWKLALVLNKKADPKILKSYSQERVENAKNLLKTTDRFFDILVGKGAFSNFVRTYIFPYIAPLILKSKRLNKIIFPVLSQTGISYPHNALNIKSSINKISAGDRMPYFKVSKNKDIYDFLKEPKFHLLSFGKIKKNEDMKKSSTNKLIKNLHFNKTPLKNLKGNFIALRPDNHILYIGKNHQDAMRSINQII